MAITKKVKDLLWPSERSDPQIQKWIDARNAHAGYTVSPDELRAMQNMAIGRSYDKHSQYGSFEHYVEQMERERMLKEKQHRELQEREKTKVTAREWIPDDPVDAATWSLHDMVWFTADGENPPKGKGTRRAMVVKMPAEDGPDVYVAYQRSSPNNGAQKPVMAFKTLERAQSYAATLAKINEANVSEGDTETMDPHGALTAGMTVTGNLSAAVIKNNMINKQAISTSRVYSSAAMLGKYLEDNE